MLTPEQIEQYHRDGYLLVPNVLSSEQVQSLRSFFRPKFDLPQEKRCPTDTDHWLLDIFCRYPESHWLCFHEPTLQVLRALLGDDFILYAFEGTVHLNWFGGWHKDTGTPERQGHTFFFANDYEMLTVAYYLQDNSPEYGGGLDVEPGTHRDPDRMIQPPAPPPRSLLTRVWHQLDRSARRQYWEARARHESWKPYVPTNVYSIPSKAGDLVLIDSRINHHATPPRQTTKDGFIERGVFPPEREKLAIFFGCTRNTPPASAYVNFIVGREDYPHLKGYSYPAELFEAAKQAGVNIMGPGCLVPTGGPASAGRHAAKKQPQLVS